MNETAAGEEEEKRLLPAISWLGKTSPEIYILRGFFLLIFASAKGEGLRNSCWKKRFLLQNSIQLRRLSS